MPGVFAVLEVEYWLYALHWYQLVICRLIRVNRIFFEHLAGRVVIGVVCGLAPSEDAVQPHTRKRAQFSVNYIYLVWPSH
jgi:hypothetical protein